MGTELPGLTPGSAPGARLTCLTVGLQGALKVAGGPIDVDVERIEAGPTGGERGLHHLNQALQQPGSLGPGDGLRTPRVVQCGQPLCLAPRFLIPPRGQEWPLERPSMEAQKEFPE
ncbi:hypothetical protein GCM10023354_13510 [Garicola koreensis]